MSTAAAAYGGCVAGIGGGVAGARKPDFGKSAALNGLNIDTKTTIEVSLRIADLQCVRLDTPPWLPMLPDVITFCCL
jgi:hypothetical protein